MKKIYFILIVLVLIGAVGGYFLIPREKEIALIQYKEQVYDFDKDAYKAKDAYVRRFEEGDRSIDVINALVDIYLQEGNVNEAIVVLEAYVEENPHSVPARKQLGTLYQYAQRPKDYLSNLEEINRLSENKNVLRDLSDIYSFNAEYKKKAEVMNELIANKEPLEPAQYIELANLQAASQKTPDAITTLRALKEAHGEQMNYDAVRLLVSLLLDMGNQDEALSEAQWWQGRSQNVEDLSQLANILHFKGSPALAERFLEPYGESLYEHAPLAAELVYVRIAQGKESEAFDILTRLHEAGRLTDDLIDTYLLLALRYGDEALIAELTNRISPETMEEPQAISLVEVAQSSRRRALLHAIDERLGTEEYRQAHPLFSLVLGLALREVDMEAKVATYLDETTVTDPQRVVLARACANAGKTGCAKRLIEELKSGDIDNNRLAAIGGLYLDIRRYDEGYAYVDEHREADSSVEVERVWVKLASATGHDEAVVDWISRHEEQLNEGLLTDIYFLSIENGHYALALDAAQLLNGMAGTTESRTYLAQAYLKAGRFEEALSLLRDAGELTDEVVDSYLAALIQQARRDPSYRDELAAFASEQLASGEVSGRRKLALVYALIDGGRADIAMPYIRELAMTSGGDWAYIYAENLDKMGKYEEARQFWLMAAKRRGVSADEKRSIAFALLDKGYAEDAEGIFADMAQTAGPKSTEVSQLLYLWGPRLEREQLEWLYARSLSAEDPVERDAWRELVMNYASAEGVVGLAETYPDALRSPQIMDAYLQAQYGMRNKDALDALLVNMREGRMQDDTVRRYARFARDYNMPGRATAAYERLLQQREGDEEALREIGVMAYGRADYSRAKAYLGNYLAARQRSETPDSDAYLAYFYYAELLRREKKYDEAYPYYQAALDVIRAEPNRTPDMESKAQQSMVWLGNVEGGIAGFQEAVGRYPSDEVLHADYVSTLVEQKRYDQAKKALKKPMPVMAEFGGEVPLEFSGREFTAYKLLDSRREVLLAFNPKVTPTPSISENASLSYPWISYVTQGYDEVLVAAKPAYTLEVIRRRDGGVTIVPQPDEAQLAQAADAQARLRYELLAARLELETGEQYAATDRLNKLLPHYPDDSQLLGYTANAENYVGRWQRALRLLRRAHELAPENEDIQVLKRDIEKLHAQHVMIDHEWRALGDNDEQITTLAGFATVSEGMDIGASFQNNEVDSATVRRADGRIGSFDESKQRGELFARYITEEGTTLKGALFANNDTVGIGGYIDFINQLGTSGIALELRRPYWEFVEGVLDDATRDRAEIHHTARIDQHITVQADASLNRYNVEDEDGVASSAGIGGTVGYQFMDEPYLAVLYSLDAEYELDHDERTDAAGTRYRPFPFRSREVHSLALAGTYRFTRETYLDFLAGYGFDRLGGNGPIGEVRLTHEITDDLEAQVRAFYGIGAGETDDDISRVGAYLKYRY